MTETVASPDAFPRTSPVASPVPPPRSSLPGTPSRSSLPYGPIMTRLLRPLQRGFLVVNGSFMAPLLRHGFGWLVGNPLTGHLMLLRTRGRRSGLLREAPLGYVVRDGAVYCVAGYGAPTPWFRNLVADPNVEVILPTRRFKGRAEPVTDAGEWLTTYRALIASFGLVGRAVVGDIRCLDDATLLDRHRSLPVVRVKPRYGDAPLVAGPFDPGGLGWIIPYGLTVIALVAVRAVATSRREAPRRAVARLTVPWREPPRR